MTMLFFEFDKVIRYTCLVLHTSANPVLSDSGAPMKFTFCMLKNTTQADFQLKMSTP